jgi:signal transduction histidine kinase
LIARELHDIVAHHLSVIVVQAGAGRMAALGPSQRASERFATIRQAGDQALGEMARLVDMLHAHDTSQAEVTLRWRFLLEEACAGGLDVRISALPSEVQAPGPVADNAYSVVREALTNAIKHSPGSQVTVQLARCEDHLEIDVHDNGSRNPGALADTGAGLGLIGMRELIESNGGRFEAGPDRERGWRLCARLPLAPPAVSSFG